MVDSAVLVYDQAGLTDRMALKTAVEHERKET